METTAVYFFTPLGLLGFRVYWGLIRIMEKKMETTGVWGLGVYWGQMRIMEKNMQSAIVISITS